MSKTVIQTDQAPAAVGPYSQAIHMGNLLFTAGQLGIDPSSKQLVEGVEAQTRQALENIKAILTAAGASLEQVVKTTVFLQDMNDFAAMNAIYATYFAADPPARSTVQVAKLPMGGLVEIETITVLGS